MKTAFIFGILYAVILFVVAAARDKFGDEGMFVVAALSGLTEMDAITLSTTELVKQQRIEIDMGWRMIIIGALSNMIFKAGIVAFFGDRKLIRRIFLYFGLAILGGVCIIAFWP